jgi:hypothetical protein
VCFQFVQDFGLCQSFHWAHDGAYYDQQRRNLLLKHGIDLEDGKRSSQAGGATSKDPSSPQRQGELPALGKKELKEVMSDRQPDGTPLTHFFTFRATSRWIVDGEATSSSRRSKSIDYSQPPLLCLLHSGVLGTASDKIVRIKLEPHLCLNAQFPFSCRYPVGSSPFALREVLLSAHNVKRLETFPHPCFL